MSHMVEKIGDQSMGLKKVYRSEVDAAINNLFRGGKKAAAERVFFKSVKNLKKQTKVLPYEALKLAIDNACPLVQLKSKKVGGISYKIPVHIFESKRSSLGIKWLVSSSCGRKVGARSKAFSYELVNAFKEQGNTVQRKKSLHNLAITNRAYIKFL